ncbi:MAG: hypothetical protein HKL80_02255 [Acidimicrobiales bacterium]|nr:hypothetical protein [Acidimicrobiales bacterium]
MSLDELGSLQPGMARLMVEISGRMSKCWWAGKYKNTPLAKFQLAEAVKLLKMSSFVRPKYDNDMLDFLDKFITPIRTALQGENWEDFYTSFDLLVIEANRYHERYGKGFLV